jgi:ABC-2 type transport system permease protein
VLYCGADFPIVYLEILATAVIGNVYFGFALYRFRRVVFQRLTPRHVSARN